jgi:hypothetical protein
MGTNKLMINERRNRSTKRLCISLLLWCGILLNGLTTQAQVSVQLTHTGGLLTKDQLWNLLLVNTGPQVAMGRVEITLSEIGSNQLLCRFTSRNLSLPAGAKTLSVQDVLPVQTVNYRAGFTDMNPYGVLPPGRYYVCVDVLRLQSDTYTSVGEGCEEAEALVFSPVLLNQPENAVALETKTPLFTWLAPQPAGNYNQLKYDLKLVRLLPNQQAVEGIDQNLPVLQANNINNTSFNYLTTHPGLQAGGVYAWQVTARNGMQPVSVSEVWTFVVGDSDAVRPWVKQAVYSPLRKEASSNFITITGDLNIEYNNELNDSTVTAKIIDINAAKPQAIVKENLTLPLIYGPNFLSLPVREEYNLGTGRFYKLILENSKKEEWTITFIIK